MVNKHQFQLLAKAFRAGKISLAEFTEQAFNDPAGAAAVDAVAGQQSSSRGGSGDSGSKPNAE